MPPELWCAITAPRSRGGGLPSPFGGSVRRIERLRAELRAELHVVLDLHAHLPTAMPVVFAEPIVRFLGRLFLRPPMSFQNRCAAHGTGQHLHRGHRLRAGPLAARVRRHLDRVAERAAGFGHERAVTGSKPRLPAGAANARAGPLGSLSRP